MKKRKKKSISKSKKEANTLGLSQRGVEAILDLLDNPPEPNEALKKAALKYKKLIEEGNVNTQTD